MPYKVGQLDKTMLATHLQPTDARRLLPTWDEQAFRARFQLTVDVPAGFLAYSNTPVQRQETLANGWQRFVFGVTPPMSSYLMVLVAGELSRISARQDGVDIGIVTTEGKQESARFALASTQDLLHYYNQYFGLPYPLPKLDQIAIPGGFSGAMENWGSIVYNEASLLYDGKKSTEWTRAIGRNRFSPSIVDASSDAVLADMLEEHVQDNFGADALVDARRTGATIRIRALQKTRLLPQVSAALKASSPAN